MCSSGASIVWAGIDGARGIARVVYRGTGPHRPSTSSGQGLSLPEDDHLHWELAHRPRGVYEATLVTIDAPTAGAAVDLLRQQIPLRNLVLFVRVSREPAVPGILP